MNPARQSIRYQALLLCAQILLLIASAGHRLASAQTYSVVDLGTLGGAYSMAYGINAAGTVVGVSALSSGRELPFFWNPSGIWTLSMPGSRFAVGRCINAAGQIAGYTDTPTGRQHAFLWSSTGVQDLGTLGGSDSFAYGINAGGQVVGVSSTANGPTHACRWANGSILDLGTLGGSISVAYGINASGQVVGVSRKGDDYWERAFLWANGSMQELSGLPNDNGEDRSTYAYAINDAGQVVGVSSNGNSPINGSPCRWTNGTPERLWGGGAPYSINSSGQVVGFAEPYQPYLPHAWIYPDPAGLDEHGKDLNNLIDPDLGWDLRVATCINDGGQIVGYGYHLGQLHAFRLIPLLSAGWGRP